jgi:glycosyltransferase involved in cell wall biosynthesis
MTIGAKVVMLVENLPVPTDRRVWAEAMTLREHGYQVSVICPKGATSCRESHVRIDGVEIYRYSLPSTGSGYVGYALEYTCALLATFWLSVRVWLRHGFDMIHAANPPDLFFLIGLVYRLAGKQFIYDQHDLAPELFEALFGRRRRVLRLVLRRLEAWSYRTAKAVIVTNGSQRDNALGRGHIAAQRIFVVRNGPRLRAAQAAQALPSPLPDHHYLLTYVGVMGRQDGVEYALYALRDVLARRGRRDVELALIGAGAELPRLRQLAKQLGLEQDVVFTGWLQPEEVASYLRIADVGLVPDPRSPLNERSTLIKVLEYMAMGKPVVAFDLPETRVSAGDAALYAVPNRVEDFARQIQTLLDSAELRREMGVLGRQRIEAELAWDHTQKALLQAYAYVQQPVGALTAERSASARGARLRHLIKSTTPE